MAPKPAVANPTLPTLPTLDELQRLLANKLDVTAGTGAEWERRRRLLLKRMMPQLRTVLTAAELGVRLVDLIHRSQDQLFKAALEQVRRDMAAARGQR